MAADGWVGIPGSIFHSFVERNIQVSSIASPYTKPNNSITQEPNKPDRPDRLERKEPCISISVYQWAEYQNTSVPGKIGFSLIFWDADSLPTDPLIS